MKGRFNTKQEMIEDKARVAAFKVMTTPDTECAWDEMIASWEEGENHPDLVLWEAFDHYRPDDLLEIFEMFVDSYIKFLEDCQ